MWKMNLFRISLILLVACPSFAEVLEKHRWISISSDSRDVVHEIIRSEVDSRQGFSTIQEDRVIQKEVEQEKEVEDREYQAAIVAAGNEFRRAKRRMDEITAQFQSASNELEESLKRVQNTRIGIENLESEVGRYEQDRVSQTESLKNWLKSEKHGDALVGVIYTRGFKDSAHELEGMADKASAPLLAQHMGTYLLSFTRVIDNVLEKEFVRTIEQGSCKWNNEEPLRLELSRNERGTTYLRLKRYELYPFQDSGAATLKPVAPPVAARFNVAIIDSRQKLESLLTQNGHPANLSEWGRIDGLLRSTVQANANADDGLKEQVKVFEDRIAALMKRIAGAREDLEAQKAQLRRREGDYHKLSMEVAAVRQRKEAAEREFQAAQASLNEKKKNHESIIIKVAVANAKGSQSPAEASAEAVMDKLAEVKNDAKTQHSSTTTDVVDSRLAEENTVQSISDARIIAVRLISFVNEGESVRVKMAFRVKTVLENSVPQTAGDRERTVPGDARGDEGRATAPREEALDTVATDPQQPDRYRETVEKADNVAEEKNESPSVPELAANDKAQPAPENPASEGVGKALGPVAGAGCRFTLRKVEMADDGLHLLVEVKNWDAVQRKVAFYDDRFGSWTKSSVQGADGQFHHTSKAFLVRGGDRMLLADLERKGRVEIPPQASVDLELVFDTYREPKESIKINLHPFVYAKGFLSDRWEEFDLPFRYDFPRKVVKARSEPARPEPTRFVPPASATPAAGSSTGKPAGQKKQR